MFNVQKTIHVLHENAEWVVPLREAFREQGLPHEDWFLDRGQVDLTAPPPAGVFYNRMSASSHTRGHRFAPELTHAVLNWLELHGRRVVNGTRALYLEVSKVAQYTALERAGVPVPTTLAAVGRDEVLGVADRFGQWPLVVKPNRGGKGLGVELVHSRDQLAALLDDPGDRAPIDGIWLVQEYVRPARPFITRCEFIGGEFFYAVEVDASQGFELCPADVCAADGTPVAANKFTILDGFSDPILERYGEFLRQNQIEVAGIEFLRRPNGEIVTYDVNTNTNYNAAAEAVAGLYGMRELARFLGEQLGAAQQKAA